MKEDVGEEMKSVGVWSKSLKQKIYIYSSNHYQLAIMKQVTTHLFQISMGPVNVFVIEENNELTLVDTGFKNSSKKIFTAIEKSGRKPEQIKRIILTHSHPDHSGSAAEIKSKLSIPVFIHADDAELLEQGIGGRLPHEVSPGFLNKILFNLFIKKSPNQTDALVADEKLKDGEILPIAGGVRVIHTPGHSKGHVSLLLEMDKVLIAGDLCANMMGLDYSTVYESRAEGTESILKVAAYEFDIAVFGHGKPLLGAANQKMLKKFSGKS